MKIKLYIAVFSIALLSTAIETEASEIKEIFSEPDDIILVHYQDGTKLKIKGCDDDASLSDFDISPDKKSAGWICSKQYFDEGIDSGSFWASNLFLLNNSEKRRLSELPSTGPWKFIKNGKQVAYHSSSLHFNEFYWLYDIETDEIVESFDPRDNNDEYPIKYPKWTEGIRVNDDYDD
jgi:hypothetical protein